MTDTNNLQHSASSQETSQNTTVTHVYQVAGMTCGHCVQAVTDELGKLPGVSTVRVDLSSGKATVVSSQPIDIQDAAVAVEEAGYQLTR